MGYNIKNQQKNSINVLYLKMWVYFMKKYFFILFSVGILYEKSNFAYNNILIIKNPTKIILSLSILNHISITENQ